RQDVFVPLPGVKQVQVMRLDGSRRTLDAAGQGLTLGATEDPLLLLYDGAAPLAPALSAPAAALRSPPRTVARREATTLTMTLANASAGELDLIAPPFWT